MRISIGYPGEEDEIGIVRDDPAATIMPKVKPICSKTEILQARKTVEGIFCDERLLQTAVGVSVSTRRHRGIELGCSPRASLMLVKAARAFALIRGRGYCIDQDFLELAPLVLSHRIRLKDIRIDAPSLIREITLHELSRIAY
jgi:MoxR-like ATPase